MNNPHKVGDVVHSAILWNGSGEGVLWRVLKVSGNWVRIVPIFTATGPSKLRAKRVSYHDVVAVDIIKLCTLRMELDEIIKNVVKSRSTDASD